MKKYLSTAAALILSTHVLFAQTIDRHIIHNFSESDEVRFSEVKHVLTEQDHFFIAGNVTRSDSSNTVFIGQYNYDAELQWTSYLTIPDTIDWMELRTFENLKPFGDDKYVLGGTAYKIIEEDTIGHPFIHIFSITGDSLHFYIHNNAINIDVGAVNIGINGEVLIAGVSMKYGLPYKAGSAYWPEDNSLKPNIWYGKFFEDYTFEPILIETPIPNKFCSIRNIYQYETLPNNVLISGYQYLNSGTPIKTYCVGYTTGEIIGLAHNVFPGSGYPYAFQSQFFPLYDFSIIPSRYDYGVALQARLTGRMYPINPNGLDNKSIMFASSNLHYNTSSQGYYPTDPLLYDTMELVYNNMLKIRESWNTDILCVKGLGFQPYENPIEDYVLDPIRGNSQFLRANRNGDVLGAHYVEYFPFAPIYQGAQMLLDIDQRPDGEKIVMAGYIRVDTAIADIWEDIGKTSWIVLMNDTSTVIPAGELPPASIGASAALLDFNIYPNPVKDVLTIHIPSNRFNASIRYVVYNVLGQEILSGTLLSEEHTLSTQSLSSGQYFIMIKEDNKKLGVKSFTKK